MIPQAPGSAARVNAFLAQRRVWQWGAFSGSLPGVGRTGWRRLLLGASVAAVALWAALRGVSLEELEESLGRADPRWVAAAVALSLVIMVLRALRWQLELLPLERVPLGRLWAITAVGYMCINLLPVRVGEVVRPWLLSRRSRVAFANVVGNVVLEKTLDSIAIMLYMLSGLLAVEGLPLWVRRGAMVPAVAAAILVLLVALLWLRGESFVDRWIVSRLPDRMGGGLRRALLAVRDGMSVLPDTRLLAAVFGLTLLLWSVPILSSWVMIRAFDFPVPFGAAVVVFIFIGFGTALPNAPGMVGVFQYACVLALGLFGVDRADAFAYGVLLNAVQLLTLIAQGLVGLAISGAGLSEIRGASTTATEAEPG